MVTLTGTLLAVTGYQEPPAWARTDAIDAHTQDHWPPYVARDDAIGIVGARTDTQPVDELRRRFAGVAQPGFGTDWYGRVQVIPGRLALGNVIGNVTRQIEVWNAWDTQHTLAAITASGTLGGIALSGQPTTPLGFGPLQSRRYTLTVSTSGDPVIDASYRFDFGAEMPMLAVTGRRIVVWSFRPDWSAGITERLTWLTDVLSAYDGSEQRVRLRESARRSIEYAYLAEGHDARLLESITFGWGARRYCLPVWWEADFLAMGVVAGASVVTVTDAALKDYRAGGLAVFWCDAGLSEAVEILSVVGNTVSLKLPLANAFPAGSRVMPAVLARLDGETAYGHASDRIVTGRAHFEVDGNLDRDPAEIGPTWQGYAVLEERPDRSDDVTETWARTLAILDTLTGIVTVDDTSVMPVIRRSYAWWIAGRAALDRWKRWASARAGRCNALWLPTFADDLALVLPAGSADTALRVRNTWSARYVGASPLRAAVRIELASGQVFHRRVTGITELDSATEAIGIDSALGVSVNVADVRRLMWLGLARLDADALEFHYETDSIARLQATFRIVPQ
jgi:hypothetical protein